MIVAMGRPALNRVDLLEIISSSESLILKCQKFTLQDKCRTILTRRIRTKHQNALQRRTKGLDENVTLDSRVLNSVT